jgi:hypothetical protein
MRLLRRRWPAVAPRQPGRLISTAIELLDPDHTKWRGLLTQVMEIGVRTPSTLTVSNIVYIRDIFVNLYLSSRQPIYASGLFLLFRRSADVRGFPLNGHGPKCTVGQI